MDLYKKEKRRIKIWLIVGILIDLFYIFKMLEEGTPVSEVFAGERFINYLMFALYPLGIVYGWKLFFNTDFEYDKVFSV
ncbi:hypothetical protein [Bacillus sp. V5-8f]|uniref:hypothetical protein n=1 Tax=Bacillus sp. V5-8f TaxID=2053044 RepID=UPI000C7912D3|nr:hypothetical protein [Bacillus sp. V5-8f]PLT32122.1 hypothetical protein CUU64_21415 [Bacillus sp. V5-8f]